MNEYELVFIVHPDLDDTAFQAQLEKVKGWITDAGGQVTKVDLWGKRKLAYPIRKQKEGRYVLLYTKLPASFCGTLERNLRFQEPVLRFLLTAI